MPSLNELSEFRSSFANVGNEKENTLSKGLDFDDLAIPDTEAAPMDIPTRASSEESSGKDLGGTDFDFSAFLDSLPDDVNPPPVDDLLQDALPSDDTSQDTAAPLNIPDELPGETTGEDSVPDETPADAGDFSIPDDLLPPSTDETEPVPADFQDEDLLSKDSGTDSGIEESAAESSSLDDSGAIDLGGESQANSLIADDEDTPVPEDTLEPGAKSAFESDEGSIDMGGESSGHDVEEASGDFSFDNDAGLAATADSGFDSLPDIDFSGMGDLAQADSDINTDSGETEFAPDVPPGGGIGDTDASAELEALGSDFESASVDLGGVSELHSEDVFGSDDFALPGLDDIFDKNKDGTTAKPAAPKRKLFGRKKAETSELPEAEEGIEEISLSQADLEKLLKTLSFYPMNLKIACEELIAEQVLAPQQLSKLIRLLVNGAPFRETAEFAEKLLGKPIVIPRSFMKMTGAAFEDEQTSFAYVFVHNFLPVLRLFAAIAVLLASVSYLGYNFVYIPIKAESIYKRGFERIPAGEYQRANQLFNEAFVTHRNKKWFYLYAEAFRDQRRYMLAEEKYDDLLRYYPRDKKGVLDYANLQTYYLLNYDKANRLLQEELLDYSPDDYDGLLAAGDNFLLWADSDPSRYYDRYEDARFSYARLIENYGWQAPVIERMMKYFIRTDNLKEVLNLRVWFENDNRRRLSPASLAELGGYLLDKQLAVASGEVKGVPDPYVESIESVRDMLLQAVREEPTLPEPHYHLARYHNNLGNTYEERLTLENAIRAFDLAQTETVRRRLYRVDTHFRYANLLVNNREFFPAEEQLIRGIQLYEDFLSRNLILATPQLGRLYAAKGDLEYFVKSGNMSAALNDYRLAERYGYAPPEIQYRMGAAYYQLEDWRNSMEYLFNASADLPLNRRMLYALGNVAYKRGDYFAAQGYYSRLIDILESQRIRLPVLLPNDSPVFLELGERLMMARNNAGVVYEALAEQTGSREYRSRALSLYAESARAWDSITRNPETMVRMSLTDTPGAPGINLGYLNANNALRPVSNFSPEIFVRIDKDVLEPSHWEELAPFGGLQ
jgi:tetratricopeptide (TPR) repeat protein